MSHKINLIKQVWTNNNNYIGNFNIEPLELNQGITLANTLRRVLLNDLSSFAITSFKINDLSHSFSNIEGLKEDLLELKANLKEIIFKSSFEVLNKTNLEIKGILNIQGPCIITAGMFKLPENLLKIINPNQYLATLTNTSNLFLEIDIEKISKSLNVEDLTFNKKTYNKFLIDANFNPIQNVNYKIKLIHDLKGNLKESIFLEIITNGSITPLRSLQESLKIILNLFYPLLLSSKIKNISLL